MYRFLEGSSLLGGILRASMLLFSFLSLFFFFGTSNVSAASVYDDAYQTTNKLRLTGTWYGIDEDISADWVQFILQDWPYDNMAPTLFRTGNNPMTEQEKQDMRDSWHNAHNWAVSNQCWFSGSDEFCDVYVYWSESPLSLTWYENGVTVTNLDYNVRISQNSGSNPSQTRTEVQVRSASTDYISRIDINETFNFIAFVDDPNYPPDYEGEELQETYIPPVTYEPDFDYSVSIDGNLSVYYLETLPLILKGTWNWQVVKTGDNWEMPLELVEEGTSSPADLGQWFVELPSAGFYHVGIGYTGSPNDTPNITISGVAIQFEWNGTGIISGSTLGCYGEDNVCNETLNNQSPFYRLLTSINVPTYGLTDALTAPINFVGTFPSLAGVCSPIQLPLPAYIGNTDNIELPCLTPIYQSYAPSFLTLWQVALTALVSYAVVNKVFAKLRETYNPRHDRIEPTNL